VSMPTPATAAPAQVKTTTATEAAKPAAESSPKSPGAISKLVDASGMEGFLNAEEATGVDVSAATPAPEAPKKEASYAPLDAAPTPAEAEATTDVTTESETPTDPEASAEVPVEEIMAEAAKGENDAPNTDPVETEPAKADPEADEDDVPRNIKLGTKHFSETERLAAQMVKRGLAPDLRTALDRISPPVTQDPNAPKAESPIEAIDKEIAKVKAERKAATEAYDTDKLVEISDKLVELHVQKIEAKREIEQADASNREFEKSVSRAVAEFPDAALIETPLGAMVYARLANLKPNDPLAYDPDRAFKVAEACAKALNLKGKSALTSAPAAAVKPVVKPPAVKAPQPPKPVSGAARTTAQPTKTPMESLKEVGAKRFGLDPAMIEAL